MKRIFQTAVVSSLLAFVGLSVAAAPNLDRTFMNQHVYFISSHPDDTTLTFGGFIYGQAHTYGFLTAPMVNKFDGRDVHNKVMMSITSWASLDGSSTASDQGTSNAMVTKVTGLRYAEDYSSVTNLFGGWQHVVYSSSGYLDAPLRGYVGPVTAGGGSGGNFAAFHAPEKSTFLRMVEEFKPIVRQEDCTMFVQLANGSHIDHFIVREAAIRAVYELAQTGEAKCQVVFGEDQPYTSANLAQSANDLQHLQARLPVNALEQKDIPVPQVQGESVKLNFYKTYYPSQKRPWLHSTTCH